jgi:hypothetical protein
MPNVYREKVCPTCQVKHRKRGPYCTQGCANRGRPEYSQKVADNMRKVAQEYNKTPEAIANQKLFHTGIIPDEFAVPIPTLDPDLSDYSDYNKAEDW